MTNANLDEMRRMQSAMSGADKQDWIMPAVLLFVGLPLVVIALWMSANELLFRAKAMPVQGVVVLKEGSAPTLTVEYKGSDGLPHQVESAGSDLYDDVKMGQQVRVYVSRANPQNARLGFFTEGYMLPLILGVFGSFFAIPGLIFARPLLRRSPRSPKRAVIETRLEGDAVEVRPVLTMAGFQQRLNASAPMECSLRCEDGRWSLTVDGAAHDPFSPSANRDWGVQYQLIARWKHPRTGATHETASEALDFAPSIAGEFGKVTVMADLDHPNHSRVVLD